MAAMTMPGTRTVALVCALGAGFALGLALASEYWGGLVPCALCLLERWPYRVAIVLALLALVVPRGLARVLLLLVLLIVYWNQLLAAIKIKLKRLLIILKLADLPMVMKAYNWPTKLPKKISFLMAITASSSPPMGILMSAQVLMGN